MQVTCGLYAGYMQVICRLYAGYMQVICRLYAGYMQVRKDRLPFSTHCFGSGLVSLASSARSVDQCYLLWACWSAG